MNGLKRARNRLANIRTRLMQNSCVSEMERLEIAFFIDYFSARRISDGEICQIIKNKAVAIAYRTQIQNDIRILMVEGVLPKIADAISDPTGFVAEGGGYIIENAGRGVSQLGRISQYFSTYLSLKTMTDIANVLNDFMIDSVVFDFWRNALEAAMVERLKRMR